MAEYEIHLSWNNQTEGFIIPVNPESIEVKEEGQGKTYNIVGKGGNTDETRAGEVNVIKSPKLKEVSFSSIFPNQIYPFVKDVPLFVPMHYINLIRKWSESKHPIRFIFAGSYNALATASNIADLSDLNFPASIESFTWKEVAGGSGDIEYTLSLKEYVFYAARSVIPTTLADGSTVLKKEPPLRPDERIRPQTVTLQANDSLSKAIYNVSKKYFGQGEKRSRDIQLLNGISDAEMMGPAVAGRVIKLPTK